jgi:peptidoglycan/xylan/chitin deacetylase (PgdA/CDA1 family)
MSHLLPLDPLRRETGVNPLIVNYHMVSDELLPYVRNLYKYRNIKTFIQDLDFFILNFHPITLNDLLVSVKDNIILPENSWLLTFDDGFKEIYETVAPILTDKNLTATVFLTKNFIDNKELGYDNKKSIILDRLHRSGEKSVQRKITDALRSNNMVDKNLRRAILNIPYTKRHVVDEIALSLNINIQDILASKKPYLTSDQINRLMDAGFTFGGHSIDHPRFTELSKEDQVFQATESIEYLVFHFGLNYRVFAFPYTDLKVSKGFFEAIANRIDITFGTSGLMNDTIKTNLQRISVEKLAGTALKTVKFHYFRKLIYQLAGKDIIKRPD